MYGFDFDINDYSVWKSTRNTNSFPVVFHKDSH